MPQLETVRIAQPSANNPNDYALINKSDFNTEIHTLWTEKQAQTEAEAETVQSDRARKTKTTASAQ